VILKRTPGGLALVKALLRGRTGTADLVVTPPNPGDNGGLVLALGNGDRYCVGFGGVGGGEESHDDAATWQIGRASGITACPSSPSITTTSVTTSTTTSTTAAPTCGSSGPACDGSCPPTYHCEGFIGGCVCVTGGSSNCAVCDTPCSGGEVCAAAIDASNPPNYTETCECVTSPACVPGTCGGSCPTGATCLLFPPGPNCACYFEP